MNYDCFDIPTLKSTIANGDVKKVIENILICVRQFAFPFNKEFYLLASRYKSLEKEKIQRTIQREDYQIEINTIVMSVLEILDSIEERNPNEVLQIQNPNSTLEKLVEGYNACKKINSIPSKLRSKNQITRKIGEVFIQYPLLIQENLVNTPEGIINGICRKIIFNPSFQDVEILKLFAEQTDSDFTNGSIINALAEIIYNGKLSYGDEETIKNILQKIGTTNDIPLKKNVERVEAAFQYFIYGSQNDLSKTVGEKTKILSSKYYSMDSRITNFIENINKKLQAESSHLESSFIIAQIDNLFNRMTFRGEPQIEMCRSQRWSMRVHSSLMTHHALLQVDPIFAEIADTSQKNLYQELLLSLSQYIDSMVTYLFKTTKISEDQIRDLLGQPEFISKFQENEEIQFEFNPKQEGTLMPDHIKNIINKYLQQTINAMDSLKTL